ncbi:MAG: glycosyl hydrolase family 18 protein [Bacteroides sp.]|nr:glycosyl hydrolase family 18 protein [Bacteroides sp.]
MFQALRDYGDRFDTVGLFTFEVDSSGTLTESGTSISRMMEYINKWPHIKWMLTINNGGISSIFTALRNNANGAQDKFMSEIVRIMEKYPWCAGVDIDLERGGEYENKDKANALFKRIYETVKAYDSSKLVNVCLPGMTGVQGSVGGENWCVYGDIAPYCDTMAIMSYGEAWAGSAPGPTSSRDWLVKIYDYATSVVPPEKLFMGLPGYGWEWQIYDTPENLGDTYRAISLTYYGALGNMRGDYRYADTQAFIPFISYWDDYDHVPWGLLYVYDFLDGWGAESFEYPLVKDEYNRHRFLTSYSGEQALDFGKIYSDIDAVNYSGGANINVVGSAISFIDEDGYVDYYLTLPKEKFEIGLKICFPFFNDDHKLTVEFFNQNGSLGKRTISPTLLDCPSYTWPYYRQICWLSVPDTDFLQGETSVRMRITGGETVHNQQIYGIRISRRFSESRYAGEASFVLSPRKYKDLDGKMVGPTNGFKLTAEVLHREPDSALIWYEDFCDGLSDAYYEVQSGSWSVWHKDDETVQRPYSQLEDHGQLALKYGGFGDVHLRARVAFPSDGVGRAGVFYGDVFCCINISAKRLELYQGGTLLGSYSADYEPTADEDIRDDPNMYQLEMRVRGNSVRVYSGAGSVLRFTANIAPITKAYAGIRSDNQIKCDLLRIGDAWYYEPYESFDIVFPNGSKTNFGRIDRSNVTWNEKYGIFKVNSNIEEPFTRTEDISMSYDFFHSHVMTDIACGGDYTFRIIPKDINIWFSRLFLGDSDGFSIQYYQDVDSLLYWANQAAYHWKMRGFALWSLGQEDMRLWEMLPKQI